MLLLLLLCKLLIDFGLQLKAVEQDPKLKLQVIGLTNKRLLWIFCLMPQLIRLRLRKLLLRRVYVEQEVRRGLSFLAASQPCQGVPLPTVSRRALIIFVVLGRHERVIEVLLLCTSWLSVSGLPLGHLLILPFS